MKLEVPKSIVTTGVDIFLKLVEQACARDSRLFSGSMVGAVVRALASRPCGLGSIAGPAALCGLTLLLVLVLARTFFLRVLWFSSLLKNQHFQIPIRSGIRGSQIC